MHPNRHVLPLDRNPKYEINSSEIRLFTNHFFQILQKQEYSHEHMY